MPHVRALAEPVRARGQHDRGGRAAPAEADPFEARTVEVEQLEPEVFETDADVGGADEVPLPPEFEADEEPEEPKPIWQRLASFIVPIGIVLYILVSALVDR